MTAETARLIEAMYELDRKAIAAKKYERRSGYWRIIDALHGDLPRYCTPEYLALVDRAISELKEDYLARRIRAELGMVA